MALIKCPDCGSPVSDVAYVCPACGRDMTYAPPVPPREYTFGYVLLFWFSGVFGFLFLIWLLGWLD